MKLKIIFFISILTMLAITSKAQSLSDAVYYLSGFVASDYFKTLGKNNDDLDLVDTLYLRALRYENNDYSEALLALAFATLPFNRMPLHVPVFGWRVDLRLPSVGDSLFKKKKVNLPSQVYFDSPKTEFGDKDKVAHFFGNAFLSYNISFFNLSKFMGIFVELFESSFEVGGGLDNRDLITNHLGELFGKSLNKNNKLLPSDAFKIYSLLFAKFY
ncbi:hypothetical protein BMS3Abin04_02221 [bacterium BMS3Abin04]|nr:hypothetical protein BMS3Abin04_02221 [bacterium BMS3Abin04]